FRNTLQTNVLTVDLRTPRRNGSPGLRGPVRRDPGVPVHGASDKRFTTDIARPHTGPMPPALRDGRSGRDPSVARALSLVLAAIALLVLVGWVIGDQRLTALTPDDDTMKPNTAACLLLLAASVLVPRLARAAAVLSLALVAATIAAVPGTVPLDVDQVLVHVDGSSPHPARM